MATKDVFTALRVDQPRDFTIDGETKTAQAGNFILVDAEGNFKILDASTFEQTYADAGTGVVGEVTEVKPRKPNTAAELDLSAPKNEAVEVTKEGITPVPNVTDDAKQEAVKSDSKSSSTGKEKATNAVPASDSGVKASEMTGANTDAKVGPASDGDKTPTSNKNEVK
jgi:hypothetical protein